MGRKALGARVLKPRPTRGGKWRVVVFGPTGKRIDAIFGTEEEAILEVKKAQRIIDRAAEVNVGQAIDSYELHMRDAGNKPQSILDTIYRLKKFFIDGIAPLRDGQHVRGWKGLRTPLSAVDAELAEDLYESLRTRPTLRRKEGKMVEGPPLSVDSHRNMLAETKTFGRWWVTMGWVEENPIGEVTGVGRRTPGSKKPQLTADEADRFYTLALQLADNGEDGALAAAMALIMNMRSSEITSLVVRNLDKQGRLIRVTGAKTDAGERSLEVPDAIRIRLMKRAQGKDPLDLVFPAPLTPGESKPRKHWRDWPSRWSLKICELAKVPTLRAHGLRRTHSTLATDAGATAEAVMRAMGHEQLSTTERSYMKRGTADKARQRKVVSALSGGQE